MEKSEAKQPCHVNEAPCRMIMADSEDVCEASSTSLESSMEINSVKSAASSSSSDIIEDASSSISNSSSSSSSLNGPLYELSELMVHLPIKRGLSKYFDGKSQSYTSLAGVKSLEDLAKTRVNPIRKKIRSCKNFGGFDGHKSIVPKVSISKKAASRSKRRSSLLCGSRSAIPVNGN